MDLIKDLFKGDKYIWGIFLTLFVISIVESFSATSFLAFRSREHYAPAMSHITILIFGFIAVFIVMNLRPHFFRVIGRFLLYVSILLLFIVLFMPKVNGASRYLLGFQPSELAKFALVTVVSSILAHGQTEDGISKDAFRRILIYSLIVCGLIFPENFSTSALLGATIFFLMFIARVQLMRILKIMGVSILAGILFLGVLYFTPEQYLKGRMLTWKLRIERSLDDEIPKVEQKIDDKNRQVQYGHMAVANGGILGKGPGKSQIRDFLPLAFSDFIFAIIIEEGGLVTGLVVMFCYLFLLIRIGIIFRRCETPFDAFLMLGLGMLITFQALTNMAVGVDLIPITGQPLPLLSRGGSSIMMTCGYFGIIQCISRTITEREEKIAMEAALAEEMAKAENADDDDLINELSEDIDSNIDVDKSYIETYEEDEIPSEESVENEFIYEENLKTESSEDEEEVDDNLYKY